jgi:hypothetical protein
MWWPLRHQCQLPGRTNGCGTTVAHHSPRHRISGDEYDLGVQQAIRHLRLLTVALVSVYLPDLSDHFIERIREASVEVVHRVDAAARSDRNRQRGPESGSWIS